MIVGPQARLDLFAELQTLTAFVHHCGLHEPYGSTALPSRLP
jgi:hypothetical protein